LKVERQTWPTTAWIDTLKLETETELPTFGV